jgi:hypothetical protein
MSSFDYEYHMDTLREQDPDYIVDALALTTEELLHAFSQKAIDYIEEEYG